MIYLSSASSFWFSLDSSYDHEFHLSKRFGMSPQDYERLLVAAHLAHFHKKWGFSIKKVNWNLFVEGHRFKTTTKCTGTFEVDAKKLDLKACINGVSPKHRLKNHFIRIGILHQNSPRKIEKDSDGRLIVIPPRLNGLRIKQQSFKQFPNVDCRVPPPLPTAARRCQHPDTAIAPPSRHRLATAPRR